MASDGRYDGLPAVNRYKYIGNQLLKKGRGRGIGRHDDSWFESSPRKHQPSLSPPGRGRGKAAITELRMIPPGTDH
jgi:hypothetical protein